MKQLFGSQGTPEQIKSVEEQYLTEEQKRINMERAATLEHGFNAGKEFMRNKNVLDKDTAKRIFNETDFFDVDILTPSGATKRINGRINDLSRIDYNQFQFDNEIYSLSIIKKIKNTDTGDVLWDNEDETYDGFANKHGKTN